MRIRVYRYGDNPDKSIPRQYVTKSTATRWNSWGTHVWVAKASIQERYQEPFRNLPNRAIPLRTLGSFSVGRTTEHAPDRLPPVDLPGLKFKLKRTYPPYFGTLIRQSECGIPAYIVIGDLAYCDEHSQDELAKLND